ncbi:hypothetical protein VTK73DRAFT_3909 [Phialemonium thermophilum]|uniref:alpha-1,2-Mannosidase n=1 Tax=Phialemonium thermophilum TaxID=223376 RepID=A0ABR3VEJ3_9PEZI
MNVRDPFNLRRTTNSAAFDILRATATQAATGIRDKAAEVGSSALEKGKQAVEDMSFAVPRNVPSFGNPQRIIEDQLWASSGRASSSSSSHHHPHRGPHQGGGGGLLSDVQNRVGGILHPDRRNALPMKKRVLGLLTLILVLLLWYRGSFSEHHERARATISQWSWLQTEADAKGKVDWLERRQRVVEAFELSWDAYERHAWGYDEFHPIAKTGKQMAPKGLGWIIIDSLDTLMLMNQTSRLAHAREWLSKSLTWDQNQDVNTFETTIRMLGGLLSAHYLSNEYPQLAALADDDEGAPGEDLYLEKAKDLADRLLAAFDSPSGVPYASVNLGKMEGLPSHADDGASSTAETTTLQLEFKYMAKLTGERLFWDKAEKVMQVVDDNGMPDGLLPIYIYADSGKRTRRKACTRRCGARRCAGCASIWSRTRRRTGSPSWASGPAGWTGRCRPRWTTSCASCPARSRWRPRAG